MIPVVSGSVNLFHFAMIELRHVSVHNLKGIDLDLPYGKLIVLCGRSGSGKSSLAMDTLYAEGQRRYVETFSASTRQFLEKLEKPDAERIDGIPPAVAVAAKSYHGQNRSTLGTVTEITDYLGLLFTKIGHAFCPKCSREIKIDTPQSVLQYLKEHFPNENKQVQIAFAPPPEPDQTEFNATWKEQGFVRGIIFDTPFRLDEGGIPKNLYKKSDQKSLYLIVDRLTLGTSEDERFIDSLETAMEHGGGACVVLFDTEKTVFSRRFSCGHCDLDFPDLEPKLFSFNHSKGACPVCEGSGKWGVGSGKWEVGSGEWGMGSGEWEVGSGKWGVGSREREVRRNTFYSPFCSACNGTRLRPEALAVKIVSKNIAELSDMRITELQKFFKTLDLPAHEYHLAKTPLEQIRLRLEFLQQVGLDYLTLSRSMPSLSGGEQRRVGLTSALGSSLVDMLYVLDEPSIGLHPADTDKLLESIRQLRDRGNTVVLVEHEEAFLRAADHIVEIGPGAGESGGKITFQGTVQELIDDPNSITGKYLSSHSLFSTPRSPLSTPTKLEIIGCRGNNLKNLTVAFPLGVLCAVTGVSGAGKSSLVHQTLYPALCKYFGTENTLKPLPFDKLVPCHAIDDVVMVDQSSIGRSPRSNPVTYLKIFDEIRNVFAATLDAKTKNFTAGHFSFNVEGGRCEHCKGDGSTTIDMQFLPEMFVRCSECHGKRYRSEILEILYRGKNIAEVLEMTAREAFSFFRGQRKVQQKLKRLLDVGLDYIQLGQPANTLSGGESQRLKLAAYLAQIKKGRSLILMDEPTAGLHFADVELLLDCFRALIETGHSLIVVEHNLQMIRAADYIIDLGPGAADDGGKIVAQGTPEEIIAAEKSLTGKFL